MLPVSQFDDELRFRIARAIYGNSSFWNYAAMANPPIHIVVNRGRVTLTGVVNSNVERMLARSLATGFGSFEVKNDAEDRRRSAVGVGENRLVRRFVSGEPGGCVCHAPGRLSIAASVSSCQLPVRRALSSAYAQSTALNSQLDTGN